MSLIIGYSAKLVVIVTKSSYDRIVLSVWFFRSALDPFVFLGVMATILMIVFAFKIFIFCSICGFMWVWYMSISCTNRCGWKLVSSFRINLFEIDLAKVVGNVTFNTVGSYQAVISVLGFL